MQARRWYPAPGLSSPLGAISALCEWPVQSPDQPDWAMTTCIGPFTPHHPTSKPAPACGILGCARSPRLPVFSCPSSSLTIRLYLSWPVQIPLRSVHLPSDAACHQDRLLAVVHHVLAHTAHEELSDCALVVVAHHHDCGLQCGCGPSMQLLL